MKSVTSTRSLVNAGDVAEVRLPYRSGVAGKLADYIELTKPKIALMSLVTVTVGFTLGSTGQWQWSQLTSALCGIALVAAASSALNQWIERETDGRMDRTSERPLPSNRLQPVDVLCFGIAAGVLGTFQLVVSVNLLTAALAALTLFIYVAVYTPLKRRTSFCTTIGAVAGALPPVLGWTAAGGRLDGGAFVLFAILFLWQFPHFLAIAWLYRHDYAHAGLRMLPPRIANYSSTGLISMAYALALLPVSLLPRQFGLAGSPYFVTALLLSLLFLLAATRFLFHESHRTARELLWCSLIYLPALLLTLTWDHLRLLG